MLGKALDAEKALDRSLDASRAFDRAEDFAPFFEQMDRAGGFPDSQRIFRKEVRTSWGLTADEARGLDAHHVFPKTFRNQFLDKWRIDVWDPRYSSMVDASAHRGRGGWSPEYNDLWREFLKNPHSTEEVFDYAKYLGRKYGFEVLF